MTGVSHERLIIFHTWVGWAMLVLALVHTFPFIVYHIRLGDMVELWNTSIYYWYARSFCNPTASDRKLRSLGLAWQR